MNEEDDIVWTEWEPRGRTMKKKERKPKQPRQTRHPFAPGKAGRITGVDVKVTPAQWEAFRGMAAKEGKDATVKINEYIAAAANDEAMPPPALSRTKQEEFDRRLRNALKKQEQEFDWRVRQEVKKRLDEMVLPALNKRMEEYNRVIASRKGIMTKAQYRQLSALLHPDRIQDEALKPRYAEAFDLFRSLEMILVAEKEMPTGVPPLPRTVEELEALRAKVAAERRAKREAARNH